MSHFLYVCEPVTESYISRELTAQQMSVSIT